MNKPALVLGVVTIVAVVGVLLLAKSASTSNRQQSTSQNQAVLVKADNYRSGPDTSKVTIVEFGDYQCPACASIAPALDSLVRDYDGKVSLIFRNFPLPMHQNAQVAAQAAEAAGLQGKYWPMHDLLYTHQSEWASLQSTDQAFSNYAQQLGLDRTKFMADMRNDTLHNMIQLDVKDGQTLDLQGTPSLFINGHLYDGQLDYTSIKSAVENAMK